MITFIPFFLGCIVVISLFICKSFNSPKLFLLIIILTSIFYQIFISRKYDRIFNFEEKLINMSKFIVISGVSGVTAYLIVRTIGSYFS